MLSALLPGLRELRTPLISGYIWFLTITILAYDNLAGIIGVVLDGLNKILGIDGSSIVLAAISIVCYLLGSILNVDLVSGHLSGYAIRLQPMSHVATDLVRSWTELEEEARSRGWRNWDVDAQYMVRRCERESRTLALMMLAKGGADARLYEQYDRLQAEADLRVNLLLPVIALSLVAAVRWGPFAVSGIALGLVMAYQGLVRLRRARDIVLLAVDAGVVTPADVAELRVRASEAPPPVESCSTSFGEIVRSADGIWTLPSGEQAPLGTQVLPEGARRVNGSEVLPTGTLRYPDGRLSAPPWKGVEESASDILLSNGNILTASGTERSMTPEEQYYYNRLK